MIYPLEKNFITRGGWSVEGALPGVSDILIFCKDESDIKSAMIS
jgi:hypothetical protein